MPIVVHTDITAYMYVATGAHVGVWHLWYIASFWEKKYMYEHTLGLDAPM